MTERLNIPLAITKRRKLRSSPLKDQGEDPEEYREDLRRQHKAYQIIRGKRRRRQTRAHEEGQY